MRLMFGCMLRGCAIAQDWKKNQKAKKMKSEKKKMKKQTYWFKPPEKHQPPQASCVSCVCMALVGARREVHKGGVREGGIGRVFVNTL